MSDRVRRLNGVVDAGLRAYTTEETPLSRLPHAFGTGTREKIRVVAAEPQVLDVLGARLVRGRLPDEGFESRRARVAMVDEVAAKAIGVNDVDGNPLLYVGGEAYAVVGVFEAANGDTSLTGAVVLPYWVAHDSKVSLRFGAPEVVIRTDLGAADQVGDEASLAVRPENPASLAVLVPPDLSTLRRGVETQTRALFLGLAAVSLVIGALGVSNTTYVSVVERRPEIGLRRAVGASRGAIGLQFILESGLLGLVGGVLGTVVGIDITAITCIVQGWLVVLEPTVIAAGPALGLLVGMAAGVYPAVSAARTAPADSLRS